MRSKQPGAAEDLHRITAAYHGNQCAVSSKRSDDDGLSQPQLRKRFSWASAEVAPLRPSAWSVPSALAFPWSASARGDHHHYHDAHSAGRQSNVVFAMLDHSAAWPFTCQRIIAWASADVEQASMLSLPSAAASLSESRSPAPL